ncbi:Hint domain-containing protein [Pseudooceanicola onchidii]|uniref:Hint domain-containing protein n=1 Tax=Pseudooceanicola onchidii TaxID=2562279 RepID=UPI0010A9FCA1|nr:Hint domain-containing protein [Pseudooceanicola onchidii]
MSGPFSPARGDYSSFSPSSQSLPTMRRYLTSYLSPEGHVCYDDVRAPNTPEFQCAFNALAHGSLIATTEGEVAIEDLRPGMQVITAEHGPQPVLWIGSMAHNPDPNGARFLTRVTADRFAAGAPPMDLLCGPGARLLHRPAGLRSAAEAKPVFTPLRDFVDGDSVIAIAPRMAVETYHIALKRHATIRVGGLDLETFHPGMTVLDQMGVNTRDLFISMFPHIRRATDFGPLAHPRVTLRSIEDAAA